MTIIEKIKQSVEGTTGMPFLYHAAGELNELIARCGELPVAYSFLIDSGTIDDVNGRYHERVTIAVMFCDKTKFDFNALENEQIIDRMKVKAYKWMHSLRMSNALRIVSVNNTQRLYDNTTDILTGFAVNITLEDIAGVGECELPAVLFEIKENGEYPVVGIDKVLVDVLPKSTDIVITENGEYNPNDYEVDAFSKVGVDVKPKLEDLTATDNGTYTPSEGFDGFDKVNVDLRGKVKLSGLITITNNCINADGEWENGKLLDWSTMTSIKVASSINNLKRFDYPFMDTSNVTSFELCFRRCTELRYLDIRGWDFGKATVTHLFHDNYDLPTVIGDCTLEDVENNGVTVYDNCKVQTGFYYMQRIRYSSLLAAANGVADMSDSDTQQFIIDDVCWNNMWNDDDTKPSDEIIEQRQNKLTETLTNKNWTITLY